MAGELSREAVPSRFRLLAACSGQHFVACCYAASLGVAKPGGTIERYGLIALLLTKSSITFLKGSNLSPLLSLPTKGKAFCLLLPTANFQIWALDSLLAKRNLQVQVLPA